MRPLEGVKIIELAEYVALPAAPRILADWGAHVVKVEKPTGDPQRRMGLSFKMKDFTKLEYNHVLDMTAGGTKDYISLNLKSKEGMDILLKMLEDTDVLATSWRPQALRKLGLDYQTLKEKFPRLVYAQIVAYGEKGEYAEAPGYDAVCYSARGGIMRSMPQKGDQPANAPQAFGDLQAATALAAGICGALLEREKTGQGDRVSVSLYHTAIFMMSIGLVSGNPPYTNGCPASRMELSNPFNNSYPTKDGQWLLICLPDYNVSFNQVMRLIGRDDLVDSPEWGSLAWIQEGGRHSEIIGMIEEGFKTKTCDEWMGIFKKENIPGGKCFTVQDIVADDLAWENGFLRKQNYPDGFEGIVTDTPIRFDSQGLPPLRQAKPLGADTVDVLKQYGYTEQELEDMEARSIIYTHIQDGA